MTWWAAGHWRTGPRSGRVCGSSTSPLAETGGWRCRAFGEARDSFAQPVYAHTSPVYVGTGLPTGKAAESATGFAREIERYSETIGRCGRFARDEQREEVLHLFAEGRAAYERLVKGD